MPFFWVFGMTRPGIEPQSPRPLVNTLLIRAIVSKNHTGKNIGFRLLCFIPSLIHLAPSDFCPVGWGCRINRLLLCLGGSPPPSREAVGLFNECPGYNTKQSDGEVPVILGLWGVWSTLSLSLLLGPLC